MLLGAKATLVFTEADGSMIHPQTLNGRFASAAAKSGARSIGLHGLRHTHATLALEAGVPLTVVSERLGHASIQVTAFVSAFMRSIRKPVTNTATRLT